MDTAVIPNDCDIRRKKFNVELQKLLQKKSKTKLLTKDRYDSLIQEWTEAHQKQSEARTSKDDRLLQTYGLSRIKDVDYLIMPYNNLYPIKRYVHTEELFDILDNAHLKLDHGNRYKMKDFLLKFYMNITVESIKLYLKFCNPCSETKKHIRKLEKYPKLFKKSLMKWQIDIIDMKSNPDGDYCYILNFKDCETNFSILRPLKNDDPELIASQLKNIFGFIGAPHVLTSHHGQEFVFDVIKYLKLSYSDLKIVVGKQSGQKPESEKIQELISHLCKNRDTTWSEILAKLQFELNSFTPEESKAKSPFEAFFGREPQFGLSADFCYSENFKPEDVVEEKLEQYCQKYLGYQDKSYDDSAILFGNSDEECDNSYELSNQSNSLQNRQTVMKMADLMKSLSCQCKTGCLTERCRCRAANISCNSKCHMKSSNCKNDYLNCCYNEL